MIPAEPSAAFTDQVRALTKKEMPSLEIFKKDAAFVKEFQSELVGDGG